MSLSSFLLSKAQGGKKRQSKSKDAKPELDEGLDALFRANPVIVSVVLRIL
jgi:hypothetical protein